MFFNNKLFENIEDKNTREKYNIRYGLRGDPSFIEAINEKIVGQTIDTKEELIAFVDSVYFNFTGKHIKQGEHAFAPALVKGSGMSDGYISDVVLDKGGFIDKIAEIYNLK